MFRDFSNLNVKYSKDYIPALLISENKLVFRYKRAGNRYNFFMMREDNFEYVTGTPEDINKLKVIYELYNN